MQTESLVWTDTLITGSSLPPADTRMTAECLRQKEQWLRSIRRVKYSPLQAEGLFMRRDLLSVNRMQPVGESRMSGRKE